jgi:hypothetical protein
MNLMGISIRNIAAYFFSTYLLASGKLRKLKAAAARGEFIISVYFHDPSRELFESCVRWFQQHGFQFISVQELVDLLRQSKPFPPSAVVFTVDDGWKNNRTNIAGIAEKYKVPVTIFASTDPVEKGGAFWWSYAAKAAQKGLITETVSGLKKWPDMERKILISKLAETIPLQREAMTIAEIQEIAKGNFVQFGSHTVTHPILTTCSDLQSELEIKVSKTTLQNWLQKEVHFFAYPNGLFTQREINYLHHSGYDAAFTTVPVYITPENRHNLFELPRFDVLENISFKENICRMTGLWFNRKKGNPTS